MNVIVLAGGYAERLWPLTENFPKTMLKVAGKPVLYFLLENISKLQGISSITIAVDKDKKTYFESAIDDINVYSTIRPKLSVHELNHRFVTRPKIKCFPINSPREVISVLTGE